MQALRLSLLCFPFLLAACDGSSGGSAVPGHHPADAQVTTDDASAAGPDGGVAPGADGGGHSDAGAHAPDMALGPWQPRLVFDADDGLEGPDGLFPAGDGTVLVANEVAGNVLRVDVNAGTVAVEVEGGDLRHPEEVTLGPDGDLWISDDSARAVFRVVDGEAIIVVSQLDGLGSPEGIAVDADGVLYIGDEATQRLYRLRPGGELEVIADSDDGVFAPEGMVVDAHGTVYATDDRRGGVLAYDANGPRVFLTPQQLIQPEGVAVAPDGTLWFTDHGAREPTLQRFTRHGEHLETIPMPVAPGTLAGIAVLGPNQLVVSVFRSRETHEIWVVER